MRLFFVLIGISTTATFGFDFSFHAKHRRITHRSCFKARQILISETNKNRGMNLIFNEKNNKNKGAGISETRHFDVFLL